jgi:predicted outer membrane protein
MDLQGNQPRRDFIKNSLTGTIALAAGLSASGTLLQTLTANAETKRISTASALTEKDFRNGVMPRAQLSVMASQLAVDKATQANAKEFAGFELEEAIAVVKVLKSLNTPTQPISAEGSAFIEKLKSASGNEFDKLYMQAELTNHEFLRDLAKSYLDNSEGKTSAAEKEIQHLATLTLFAFHEHVALCKRIYGEVTA